MSREQDLARLIERAGKTRAYGGPVARPTVAAFQDIKVTEKAAFRADPAAFAAVDAGQSVGRYEAPGNVDSRFVYRTEAENAANAAAVAERWKLLLKGVEPRFISLMDHNWGTAGLLVEGVARLLGAPLQRAYPYVVAEAPFTRVAAAIRQMRATAIVATAAELLDMEAHLRRYGSFVETCASVKRLLLVGEPTTSAMRTRLGRAWDATAVVATYGSLETGTIATGCEHGALHVFDERFVCELRLTGDLMPLEAGAGGELIVTPLCTEGAVLLRYATDDAVCADHCDCGMPGVALYAAGRKDDTVIGPDDERVGPEVIEELAFDTGAQDYELQVDDARRLTGMRLLRLPGDEVQVDDVRRLLRVPVTVVDMLPSVVEAASVVKRWPLQRESGVQRVDDSR